MYLSNPEHQTETEAQRQQLTIVVLLRRCKRLDKHNTYSGNKLLIDHPLFTLLLVSCLLL